MYFRAHLYEWRKHKAQESDETVQDMHQTTSKERRTSNEFQVLIGMNNKWNFVTDNLKTRRWECTCIYSRKLFKEVGYELKVFHVGSIWFLESNRTHSGDIRLSIIFRKYKYILRNGGGSCGIVLSIKPWIIQKILFYRERWWCRIKCITTIISIKQSNI